MVRAGESDFHLIEIMGCPGGCIGGGGQPYAGANAIPLDEECLRPRAEALYTWTDQDDPRTRNPDVQKLYHGVPGRRWGTSRTSCSTPTTRRSCRKASFLPN